MIQSIPLNALERELFTPDWITYLVVFCLFLLVFLKAINGHKFYGTITSMFHKGFVEIQVEEKESPFTVFGFLFTFFSLLSITLAIYISLAYVKDQALNEVVFLKTLLYVFVYMSGRFFLEFLLIRLFSLKTDLSFFFLSKRNYLFSISIGVWFFVNLFLYGNLPIMIFWIGTCAFFITRVIAILSANKNLIFSNLFYFILYLCAFEIATLLLLFKLITK